MLLCLPKSCPCVTLFTKLLSLCYFVYQTSHVEWPGIEIDPPRKRVGERQSATVTADSVVAEIFAL